MNHFIVSILAVFCVGFSFSQSFSSPESVEFDATNNRYLVSNRGSVKSIQQVIPGQAPTLFTSSVTSPAGLEILNGKLWVCDGGNMKSFDLSTGVLVDNIAVGGTFLNGITSDGVQFLFVSDFSAKKIYRINTISLTSNEMVANTVTTPNGMWYDGTNNRIVFVNWGASAPIKAISLIDSTLTTIVTTSIGNCDGIARDGLGNYFISAWSQNAVYKFDSNFLNPEAVVTGLTQPADICYNVANDTLVVPQTSANLVTFHNFSSASLVEIDNESKALLFPNPANDKVLISYQSAQSGEIDFELFALNGALIFNHIQNFDGANQLNFELQISTIPAGSYLYKIQTGEMIQRGSLKIVH